MSDGARMTLAWFMGGMTMLAIDADMLWTAGLWFGAFVVWLVLSVTRPRSGE